MKQLLCILFILIVPAWGWDSVELEVFDVVEEVNQNFYDLMGLTQEATVSDVKRAYRTLSKQIHPDKSDDPDAEIKFRQMVSVYEVLKDPERRAHYDRVLVNGLPDWRSAVYYYRRARKMSILEMSVILTVVISIAQYLMAWGSYWDQYKTFDENFDRKFKKAAKTKKAGPSPKDEFLSQIPKPSWKNILPLQLCRGLYHAVVHGPSIVREYRAERKRKIEEAEEEKRRLEEEDRLRLKEEEDRRARKQAVTKRRKQAALEVQQLRNTSGGGGGCVLYSPDAPVEECISRNYNTGMWTDDELSELTKLMNKYPGGTVDRWDLISDQLNRAPHEVTKMAVKIREKMAAGTWLQQQQEEPIMAKVKTKTRAAALDGDDATRSSDLYWTAVQQQALEKAIKAYPKGTDQRWEKIAKQVPEKSAEDCINRFKFLAEKIRKKKEEEEQAAKLSEEQVSADANGDDNDGEANERGDSDEDNNDDDDQGSDSDGAR